MPYVAYVIYVIYDIHDIYDMNGALTYIVCMYRNMGVKISVRNAANHHIYTKIREFSLKLTYIHT